MIASHGGASEPSDTLLLGKAGGAAAVRRTLASTICRAAGPMQVPRPRQLRDASPVMRFRPAHQSLINRRHDGRVSCPAQYSQKRSLERKPQFRVPATWKGGHESGQSLTFGYERATAVVPRLAAPPPSRWVARSRPRVPDRNSFVMRLAVITPRPASWGDGDVDIWRTHITSFRALPTALTSSLP